MIIIKEYLFLVDFILTLIITNTKALKHVFNTLRYGGLHWLDHVNGDKLLTAHSHKMYFDKSKGFFLPFLNLDRNLKMRRMRMYT